MYEYEWENPSHILLPPPPTSVSSDHPPEAPYSDLPSFIHPPFIPIHHHHYHQPFQTVVDPTASYSNAPLHTDSMLSSADYDTAAAFFSALPKPEPSDHTAMDGGEYHNANSSADLDRIGLNLGLGGRTYFSAADETFLNRLYRRSRPFDGSSVAANLPKCQVEGCTADLSVVKHYHRRHKVCEFHSKASTVVAGGLTQRFCQQCSRFHVLTEFDNGKRSCRRRLADHNRRRRKSHQVPASQDRRSSQPHSKAPNSPASENRPRSPSDSSRAHSVSSLTVQECKINRYNSEASPSVSSNSMFY